MQSFICANDEGRLRKWRMWSFNKCEVLRSFGCKDQLLFCDVLCMSRPGSHHVAASWDFLVIASSMFVYTCVWVLAELLQTKYQILHQCAFIFHQRLPWVESGRAFPRSYTTMDRYGDVKHIYAPQAANQPYGCMQVRVRHRIMRLRFKVVGFLH